MAILVIVQSFLPCNDEAIERNAGNPQLSTAQSLPQRDQDHKDDACSPFCHCSCCAGFSILSPIVTLTSHLPENTVHHADCYTGAIIEISLPIWQPPQLPA